ncbi:MAG: hypothetical protein EAY65_00160, partial [Alphaproteobacteria bacterium]
MRFLVAIMKYFNKKTLTILFIDGLFSFWFLLGLAGSLVHKNVYDALPVQSLVAELAFVQVLLLFVIVSIPVKLGCIRCHNVAECNQLAKGEGLWHRYS